MSSTAMSSSRRLITLARPWRGGLVGAGVVALGATMSGVLLLGLSGWLIARASQHPNEQALALAVVAVRTLGISRGVLRYSERLVSHSAAFRALTELRVRLYEALERLLPGHLPDKRTGDLLQRVTQDSDAMQDFLIRGLLPGAAAASCAAVTLACACLISAPVALALLLGLLASGVGVPWLAQRGQLKESGSLSVQRAQLSADLLAAVQGADEIAAFNAHERILSRIERDQAAVSKAEQTHSRHQAGAVALAALVSGATLWLVSWSALAEHARGGLSTVSVTVLVLVTLALFEAISPIPVAAVQWTQIEASADRVFDLIDKASPTTDRPDSSPHRQDPSTALALHDVTLDHDGAPVLSHVDMAVMAGERVAVVGPSGVGKSTLAMAALGFLSPRRGVVLVQGVDLRHLSEAALRTQVSGSYGPPHIFGTTIADNLRIARPSASDADLCRVVSSVGLTEWIAGLPEGLQTRLHSRGVTMSGGEAQRLALARCLLAEAPMLILDEPTASVDPEQRASLKHVILSTTRDRSLLVMTHDYDWLAEFDRVVMLGAGSVIAQGSHEQLLHSCPEYQRLWNLAGSTSADAL